MSLKQTRVFCFSCGEPSAEIPPEEGPQRGRGGPLVVASYLIINACEEEEQEEEEDPFPLELPQCAGATRAAARRTAPAASLASTDVVLEWLLLLLLLLALLQLRLGLLLLLLLLSVCALSG